MANIDDLLGSLDEQNKAKKTQQDKAAQRDAVTQSGDKVVEAINKNAQSTTESLKHVSGEVKVTNPDLAKSQDVAGVVESINKLNLTTFMQNEGLPQLAQNLSDLSSKTSDLQDRLENEGLQKMSNQLGQVVSKLDEVSKTISKTEISVDSKLQKTIDSLSKSINSIDFSPSVNVTAPAAKVVTAPIDLSSVVSALGKVEQAVKDSEIPETELDISPITAGLTSVQKSITALRFPVSNYVLPFKDKTGTAVQAQLGSDGSMPISNTPDAVTTGSIIANGGTVTVPVISGMAGWTMGYYGTYATGASLTMEASFDGGLTYASVRMLQGSSGTLGYVITIAAVLNSTSFFIADIPNGATHLRVRCSAWAAPTGAINIVLTQTASRYASPAVGGQSIVASPTAIVVVTGNITTSSTSIVTVSTSSAASMALITVHGAYSGVSFGVTISDDAGVTFYPTSVYDTSAQVWLAPNAVISPGTNATRSYAVPITPATTVVRVLSSAFTSGSAVIRISTGYNSSSVNGTMNQIMDAAGNNRGANVTAANALVIDIGTTAAALADTIANPTTSLVAALTEVFNGTTWDRIRTANSAANTTGTGLVGSGQLVWDGTNWQKQKADTTGVPTVNTQANPASTALNTYSLHSTTNATTTPTASLAYISSIAISVEVIGTTSTVTIQDKSGTPLKLVPGIVTTATGLTVYNFQTPLKMTGGIDIITAGAVAATIDVWINYYQ